MDARTVLFYKAIVTSPSITAMNPLTYIRDDSRRLCNMLSYCCMHCWSQVSSGCSSNWPLFSAQEFVWLCFTSQNLVKNSDRDQLFRSFSPLALATTTSGRHFSKLGAGEMYSENRWMGMTFIIKWYSVSCYFGLCTLVIRFTFYEHTSQETSV